MEFTRRRPGPATTAAAEDHVDGGTMHAADPMLVVRDALLSLLQKDRLRQEIIADELAKIERAVALRAGAEAAATPWSFSDELAMATLQQRARQTVGEHRPAMENHTGECLKPCRLKGKATQQISAIDGKKLKETSETMPVKKQNSASEWTCAVCEVQTTSERNLREHCGGQKHLSNVATLELKTVKAITGQKAKTTAEPSPGAQQKTPTTGEWKCSICQVNCNGVWDLDIHLKGKKHQAKVQDLLEESKTMASNAESLKVKLRQKNVPKHAEKTTSTWSCRICQAHCTSESDLENHLKGKRHQLEVQALHKEANHEKNNPGKFAMNQNPSLEWGCSICQAKCNSESQYEDHFRSRRHQENVESLQKEGKKAKSTGLKTVNGLLSDCSNSKSTISKEVDKQIALYFCKVCDLQCSSQEMLASHLHGKKHSKAMKQKALLTFCGVCDLQCNSEQMLAEHRAGKKHQAKLNEKK